MACLILFGAGVCAVPAGAQGAPTRAVAVSGTGVGMYPSFAASILRYGITTAADTAGAVTVTASTTDPGGSVLVDGRPSGGPSATVRLTGLHEGAEISVIVTDSAGRRAYSLIYLPAGFPTLTTTVDHPGAANGDVFLTLTDWSGTTPNYEAVVDRNGVPSYVRADPAGDVPLDLTSQPDGDYSVYRPPPVAGQTGGQVVELNRRFGAVGAYSMTDGITNTDGHDAILDSSGDRWLVGYQPNPDTGNTDAVIQEQSRSAKVLFQWDSADHVDPAEDGLGVPGGDYAHINSIALMTNGDLLASFRHLSQVMEIATHPHDGFQRGQVVWRLGGRRSSFTFVDDPYGGPCAQHMASQLPNGDILVFDNGSQQIPGNPPLCVDPDDPTGPAGYRNHTRVAEYRLDTTTHTATLVFSYEVPGRQTLFAGSAQRLPNGDTFIGWGGNTLPLATEVDADGNVVWELTDAAGLTSYRALTFSAPDATRPAIGVAAPAAGASYSYRQRVSADYRCTDTGGSNLATCTGTTGVGRPVDTSTPGLHTFTVTATDGAGNATTVTRSYTVGRPPPVHRPDAEIRGLPSGRLVGAGVYGRLTGQRIRQTVAPLGRKAQARVVVTNRGNRTARFRIVASRGSRPLRVRYTVAGADVTRRSTGGALRTPALRPGARFTMTVTVAATRRATKGARRTFRVRAESIGAAPADAVATTVRVVR